MTPPGWKCEKRIGYIFPHACTRLTPEGCQDCSNGQITDPYVRRPRVYYESYDYYDDSLFDLSLAEVAGTFNPRFTEADGESLVTPDDNAFENDMSGS